MLCLMSVGGQLKDNSVEVVFNVDQIVPVVWTFSFVSVRKFLPYNLRQLLQVSCWPRSMSLWFVAGILRAI